MVDFIQLFLGAVLHRIQAERYSCWRLSSFATPGRSPEGCNGCATPVSSAAGGMNVDTGRAGIPTAGGPRCLPALNEFVDTGARRAEALAHGYLSVGVSTRRDSEYLPAIDRVGPDPSVDTQLLSLDHDVEAMVSVDMLRFHQRTAATPIVRASRGQPVLVEGPLPVVEDGVLGR